ncbi:hypothetical protein ACB322_28630 [Klebsiella pneumoniae]
MKWINFLQRLLQRFFPKKNEIIEVKYIERDETRVLPDIPENVIAAWALLMEWSPPISCATVGR